MANELRRSLSVALRKFFYQFVRSSTTAHPLHFHALGRQAVVKAVWEADQRLADVASSYDLLYQVTPVNTEEAWTKFRKSRYGK